jgi:hypothetical protein
MKEALLVISLKNEIIKEVLRGPISEALKRVGKKVEKQHPSLQIDFHSFSYFEHPYQIRHFRYRISSKKRVLWLTYEFDNEGDFAIYYDFLEEHYVEVKNGFGGQIGYQRNIETGMKEPLVKLWKNYQIIMLMIRVSVI